MLKLTVLLVAAVAISTAQPQDPNSPGGSGSPGGPGCSGDSSSFTGTLTQIKGKTCPQMLPDDCKFYDEARINCCQTCGDKQTQQQSAAAQSNPSSSPKTKSLLGGACFHGADSVQTKEYGTISMSRLAELRDAQVLTRNDQGVLAYSSVRYWVHAAPSVNGKFFSFRTESGHRLALTGEHLIYETDCRGNGGQAIYAKNVQIGRCLYVNENGNLIESPVVEKNHQKMTGIYAPITETGSIVVNDVLASCYSYYENEALQKFVYEFLIRSQTLAQWMPASIYQAAFNDQNGAMVTVPRIIWNALQLSSVAVH